MSHYSGSCILLMLFRGKLQGVCKCSAKGVFFNYFSIRFSFLELNVCAQGEGCLLLFMCSIAEGIFYTKDNGEQNVPLKSE